MINNTAIMDSRCSDRRAIIPFFCKYQLGIKIGRRMKDRRDSSKRSKAAYVDRYSWQVVLCVIGIMILSAMDAFFTLNILAKGGEELNIFMAVLIEDNITKFVSIKLALTAFALLLLTIHQNVKLIASLRVRHLQYMVLVGYASLIGYELHLLELAAMA